PAKFAEIEVEGSLVFLGCKFEDAFTLREAKVKGDVHMEGCDFSGIGGASFRGLEARSLYLDFGVRGPNEMVWLNEMRIAEDVVLGGFFPCDVQVLREQDMRVRTKTAHENEARSRACFRRLFVGKEFYGSQSVNRTTIQGRLEIAGLCRGEEIRIERSEVREVEVRGVSGARIACVASRIGGNVTVESSEIETLDLQGSYLEGYFALEDVRIGALLNLDDVTVDRVWRMHRVSFACGAGMQLARTSIGRLVMDDFRRLYGQVKERTAFNAPRFMILKREQAPQAERKALAQEYVTLKNMLAQEGQLALEDDAYFNMRRRDYEGWRIGFWLMNHVFGWGVRLVNIVLSFLLLILGFAGVYVVARPEGGIAGAQG
ncbi:MAG: hypothetical protein D6771_00730, partial [Zetaproteobacteria bacterium]